MTDVETLVAELMRLREQVREQAVEAARERAQADAVINRLARERQTAADDERASIVAWLREQARVAGASPDERTILTWASNRIDRGDPRRKEQKS